MTWKVVTLSPDQISKHDDFRLQTQFEAIWAVALTPKDAAMFSRRDEGGSYSFYFSPRAAEIFSLFLPRYYAKDCPRPSREGILLGIGHADAGEMLA